MMSQFSDMASFPTFLTFFCFSCHVYLLAQVSCNITTGSGIMAIFFYKGLTRIPEIGNTPVWVLHNIWRLGRVIDTKFGTNILNRVLLNVAKCQGYSFYRFWVVKKKPTGGDYPSPPRIRLNQLIKSTGKCSPKAKTCFSFSSHFRNSKSSRITFCKYE